MTKIKENNDKSMDEHIFLCDCRDGDYLHLCWDIDEPEFRWLSIHHNGTSRTWKSRIKVIWSILRGEDHLWGDIVLDAATVKSLMGTLEECLGRDQEV